MKTLRFHRHTVRHFGFATLCLLGLLTGCSTYVTPGSGSTPWQQEQTDADLRSFYEAEPAAQFPAHVVAVRIQASGYSNYRYEAHGQGAYSVLTTREIETGSDFERLAALPMMAQLGSLNRLVLPKHFESVADLRHSAARLQADLLLVYTFDTSFRVKGKTIAPLQAFSLGFLPDQETSVTTTASAALYDVRTGYLYGLAEATTQDRGLSSMWGKRETLDRLRQETEHTAFAQLLGEIEGMWQGVVERYTGSEGAPLAAARAGQTFP